MSDNCDLEYPDISSVLDVASLVFVQLMLIVVGRLTGTRPAPRCQNLGRGPGSIGG